MCIALRAYPETADPRRPVSVLTRRGRDEPRYGLDPASGGALGRRAARGREPDEPGVGLVEDPLHGGLVLVLAVEADHGLGSREAVEQPPAAPERVLDAVAGGDARDRVSGDGGRRLPLDLDE